MCGYVFLIFLWTSILLSLPCGYNGDKILVFPVDGSHWVNMEVLVKKLQSRGHELSVIRMEDSWFIQENSTSYTSITVKLKTNHIGLDLFETAAQRILEARMKGPMIGALVQLSEFIGIMNVAHTATCAMLTAMLENKALMRQIKMANYDLMLTDPAMPGGIILAHYLHLPMVYNVRWMTFGEGHFSIAPSPISYVPVPGSGLTDRMGLLERSRNLLHYGLNLIQERWLVIPTYTSLLLNYFPPDADLLAMQLSAEMWLVRVDFVFEFPRPSMPNLAYIGGFQCRPAKPLPAELEEFMQSSGDHGVVVMSLGTLIAGLPRKIMEAIASAFAHIPQKVVWRFIGDRPSSLGNNTLLLEWIPQNDLLGHPKTRAFVAHGGTNGLYEAIYHGVPVLGLPLLFDQPDNIVRLQARGAARMLDAATCTSEEFLEALSDILENPTYRQNMQKLSSLHRNQPLHPLDKAVYWIEFVLRNKGARHLHAEANNMSMYSYYCLDVAAVVLLMLLVTLGGVYSIWIHIWKRETKKAVRDGNKKPVKDSSKRLKESINALKNSNNIPIPKLRAGKTRF
ncbi:UDP glucuronosyltransferase 5 family, polypeptide G2 [Pimephales promelas]|uniref:UDP glucuronosyltransferase 5 family, polypeptide G2 n=1 Tax=Pimephales promelas TaxID=90988 RepID=UPI0019556EC7|nr:UDP glucuronosyltransferase 5 family, polypeptide G2 [Pimephales promelas]XP_039531627.1 UDP glucuronosyltransferase 5 family, polypeptide G2 [Pimephales promelas]KAG1971175.1 UDP glucuronosyltransferase 5 family, polypeptide G1 [Pimephales promelas]KAG1971176.1 UDP glucuronosyltransferase 5 family, polypeptide G1 [Pimephales promelas]KAG1971177.1 UDP glucuronosyltransferase 5 family, polypeptide G1 [Pimephales promelas]KAG1971178.1 UDP glucuronosyltransferase 5 family, polypeptide G1 [Pime